MSRIICPFCLEQHSVPGPCPATGEPVPPTFVREYDQVRPLWLASIGHTAQGSASLLAALSAQLDRLSLVFDEVYVDTLDDYTAEAIRAMRVGARSGQPDGEAPPGASGRPLLLSVYNLPGAGSRCVVLYDLRGGAEAPGYRAAAAALRQSATVWFQVNLDDLHEGAAGKTIAELFKIYRDEMERLEIDLRGRNLVVVYSTAHQRAPTRQIRDYLRNDPYQGLTAGSVAVARARAHTLGDYVAELDQISAFLHEHTRARIEGGAAFINMVKARQMRLRFCVVAAAQPGELDGAVAPREEQRGLRVLDPFFWAVELERQQTDRTFQLAVDASSPEAYARAAALWETMVLSGSVTAYQLGRAQPLATPGQRIPPEPARPDAPRLIGPILEQLPAGSRLVVLADGPILDLADFADEVWRGRVVLVSPEAVAAGLEWPEATLLGPDARPETIVQTLLRA